MLIETDILNRLVARLDAALAPPAIPLCGLLIDNARVGEITRERSERLAAFGDIFVRAGADLTLAPSLADPASRTAALDRVARALAAEGALSAWRDERYAVPASSDAPPLFLLERAAARYFGIETAAVHVNGLTLLADGREAMWLARRSATKAIDPGLLDNLVGGGVAAGASVRDTLRKEAWEEAGLAPDLADRALAAGSVRIRRLQPDGVQRETIFVHDLALPADVVPINQDGEVVAFRLASVRDLATLAGHHEGPDVVTADASLVIADWLLRRGYVPPQSDAGRRIAALRRAA